MKSLEIIMKHLQRAKQSHAEGNACFRSDEMLEAFAQLEAERMKFSSYSFNLFELGNDLNSIIHWLDTCLFQFTAESCVDEREWNNTLRLRLSTLEHYIIKILAIAQILMSEDNRDIPVKVCGVGSRAELVGKE